MSACLLADWFSMELFKIIGIEKYEKQTHCFNCMYQYNQIVDNKYLKIINELNFSSELIILISNWSQTNTIFYAN